MASNLEKNPILIYCDGACSGNPGPGGWAAIIATPDGVVREIGGGALATTNNQMELRAATEALLSLEGKAGQIVVYTDSVYVIRGITQWIWGWIRRGWKTAEGKDVLNKEYWEALSKAVGHRKSLRSEVSWKYSRGHTGIPGNERCDEIAVAYSKGLPISLYRGDQLAYHFDVSTLPVDEPLPDMKGKSAGAKTSPFSYLSLLGGTAVRHRTWAECDRRVKGQSGAKFKKASSREDETTILKAWGINPSQVKDE